MLEAMKSLLGGSVGSYAPQQLQPQADSNNQQQKGQPKEAASNPAVEINLSAQARRIMEAIESGELKLDEQGHTQEQSSTSPPAILASEEDADKGNSLFTPLNEMIEEIVGTIESRVLSEEETEKIDQLFDEITSILQEQTATSSTSAEVNTLTGYEKIKAAILYGELNRLLGNVGVFFGRDLSAAKMSAHAQDDVSELFGELSSTLGSENVEKMRSPQEARVDAIFRELEQLYAAARSSLPESQTRKITDFFKGFGQSNGASFG